jgi:hypothetical protein
MKKLERLAETVKAVETEVEKEELLDRIDDEGCRVKDFLSAVKALAMALVEQQGGDAEGAVQKALEKMNPAWQRFREDPKPEDPTRWAFLLDDLADAAAAEFGVSPEHFREIYDAVDEIDALPPEPGDTWENERLRHNARILKFQGIEPQFKVPPYPGSDP